MTVGESSPRILITLCTYNERENITRLIPAIRDTVPVADLLIVDDNSPDGTATFVQSYQQHDPRVKLLLRHEKAGLGAATLAGFETGIEQGYDWLINMDADFSHPPDVLPRLLAAMPDGDVIIASRYVTGGGITGWPWFRHLMSRGINFFTWFWLGIRAWDCSGAYRAYRVSRLQEIDFQRFRSRGYAFQEEMLYRCQRAGCRIQEIPFVFVDREVGQSKINSWEVVRALWDIAALGVSTRLLGRP
ncbi:glycosyltransferase [bacterium]|nr:glycosyltransferase [bacterium]